MRFVLGIPLLVVLVLFALSNRQPVTVGFWPTDFNLVVPLAGAVLAVAAFAFLAGALIVWISELRVRRRARRAEMRIEVLEDQNRALQAQLRQPVARPVPLP